MTRIRSDNRLRTLAERLAADLNRRAIEARAPRAFLPLGDALAPLANDVFDQLAPQLSDDEQSRWLAWIEALDGAVLELPVGPGAGPPAIVRVDSPLEQTLIDLDALASREAAIRAAFEPDDDELDDLRAEAVAEKCTGDALRASRLASMAASGSLKQDEERRRSAR